MKRCIGLQFDVFVATILLLAPYCCGSDALELGETLKMEVSEEMKHIPTVILGDAHQSEATILLTAGHTYKLTAKVVGKGRLVGVILLDRNEVPVTGFGAPNGPNPIVKFKPGSIEAIAEEVHATGEYRVVVLSTRIGSCSIKVEDITKGGSNRDEETIESLQKERTQLLKKLAAVDEKIEKLKSQKLRP